MNRRSLAVAFPFNLTVNLPCSKLKESISVTSTPQAIATKSDPSGHWRTLGGEGETSLFFGYEEIHNTLTAITINEIPITVLKAAPYK